MINPIEGVISKQCFDNEYFTVGSIIVVRESKRSFAVLVEECTSELIVGTGNMGLIGRTGRSEIKLADVISGEIIIQKIYHGEPYA